MSKDLIVMIGRAIENEPFRRLLLSNPEEACKDSNLTNEERLVLKSLDKINFDDFTEGLSSTLYIKKLIANSISQPFQDRGWN